MEKDFKRFHFRLIKMLAGLVLGGLLFVSCEDDYYYDDREPEWLGASIYDYLKDDGNYNYYVQIIDELEYTEVLSKTGSKTLFVAPDSVFDKFFQAENPWGVSSFGELSTAQKKLILNFGMINNAYLIETLSNFYNRSTLVKGQAMRRETANSPFDSIPFEIGDQMPDNEYWDEYRDRGLLLLKDETSSPIVYFLKPQLSQMGISDNDFNLITGKTRENNDAYIFDKKVIKKDITCKNGYVNVLEDVLIPPTNMAEHLRDNEDTEQFSTLLERFSAPYYDADLTEDYKVLNPEFNDSIFVKDYFAIWGGAARYPNGIPISSDLMLTVDPGWNSYANPYSGYFIQNDMAAIFAPSDDAMDRYFNSGAGVVLKNRYGSWEEIPDKIIALFLNRHLRTSYLESVPSRFYNINDAQNSRIFIEEDHIESSYVGVNGVVFTTSEVYPPDDYVSVYAPVLFNEDTETKIFYWIINRPNADFTLYLNSLISKYSLFVPTDEFFSGYIDPITLGQAVNAVLKYSFDEDEETVVATAFNYDVATKTIGDSIGYIDDADFVENRLLDLLDNHIVVNGVEKGDGYYLTKGGNIVYVEGEGYDMKVQGGGDIEREEVVNINQIFDQFNGNTYFIDKPIQTPTKSVYQVLSETEEYSLFFELCNGFNTASDTAIFVKGANESGIDYNVSFLNTYNYTVYVPTEEALKEAIANGVIKPWSSDYGVTGIDDLTGDEKIEEREKLIRFLRYHFQDNSVFVGDVVDDDRYQSATLKLDNEPSAFNTFKNKYFKIQVNGDGNNLELSTENNGTASVLKEVGTNGKPLYNVLVRDYVFNKLPTSYVTINQTGTSTTAFSNSRIETSASAVIHLIDNVLAFE